MNSRKNRAEVLANASDAVLKDRNTDYGNPEDNFRDIALLWTAWMAATDRPVTFTSNDVAQMMIHVKQARLKTSPSKMDHYADIAGYAACGYACEAPDEIDGQEKLWPEFAADPQGKVAFRIDPSDDNLMSRDTREVFPKWSNRW